MEVLYREFFWTDAVPAFFAGDVVSDVTVNAALPRWVLGMESLSPSRMLLYH
jgi:hypothetical protein